ncbi:very short patch repair endonuclease [Parasphingorhabdus sp.]|uniref:very short patch repair endonuclease n=1 Tax=Parasphingorhabdus sp. TaxID=2709688 RepID=UPI003A9061C2
MADVVTAQTRSRMMSGIRSNNTQPELLLRTGLHKMGFRYRLHDKSLPGTPDIVFPRYKGVIFAHGCFWHRHNCHLFRMPSTRTDFWEKKFDRNGEVDKRTIVSLLDADWRVCIVWECALKGKTRLPYDGLISMCANWLHSHERLMVIEGS